VMAFDRGPAPKCCVRNAIATPATKGTISCILPPPSVSTYNPMSLMASLLSRLTTAHDSGRR
jgi:hypothetical protein